MASLLRYAASRVIASILVVVGSLALLCSLTMLVPGDPATILLGPRASPETVAAFRHDMGLDLALPARLLRFFAASLHGDLGVDVLSGRPVAGLVMASLPNTAALALSAMALAILIGIPLGGLAATRPGSRLDQITAIISVGVIATPSYVVAVFLLLIFAVGWRIFPVLGAGHDGDLLDQLHHLVLPAVALALGWIGYIARLIRSSLLEVLDEQHVRTLRAFGAPEHRIIFKYALKLACIPTLAIIGVGIGELLGGAVFVEIIFNRPGLGSLIFDAIQNRNYPIVQGGVLIVVTLFVLTNLLVDLSYAWLDPRLRETRAAGSGS